MTFRERILGAFGGVPATRVPELVQAGLEPMRAELVVARQSVEAEVRSVSAYGEAFAAGIEHLLSASGRGLRKYNKAEYSSHALTYACMSRIARGVARVPFRLYPKAAKPAERQAIESHPIYDLLANPFPELYSDGRQFLEMMTLFLLGGGNVWMIEDEQRASKTKLPVSLSVWGKCNVSPIYDQMQGRLLAWKFKLGAKQPIGFAVDELPHLKFANPDDPFQILGCGPVQAARAALDASFARELYDEKFFENDAEPGTTLKYDPGELGTKGQLKRDDMIARGELWNDTHRGVENKHKLGLLNAGWSLVKSGMSQRDMQFVQGELNTLRKVAMVFGVPSPLLNDFEHAAFSQEQLTAARDALNEDTVAPIAERIGGFLHRVLIAPRYPDLVGEMDIDTILPRRLSSKIDDAVKLVSIGVSLNKALKVTDTGIDGEPWGDEPAAPVVDVPAVPSPDNVPPPAAQIASARRDLLLAQAAGQRNGDPQVAAPLTAAEEREHQRAAHWCGFVATFAPLEGRYLRKVREYFGVLRRETIHNFEVESSRAQLFPRTRAIDIRKILFDLDRADARLRKFSQPYFEQAIIIGANGAAAELHTDAIGIESPSAQAALELRVTKVTDINDTVRDQLRESLREGYDAGETVSELSTRINSTFEMSIARAHVIARTEIAGSVSQGRFSEMTEQGVTRHEWISARDDHVRQPPASEFDHTIDGEIVTLGEFFSNGLDYPGSVDGDAGNVINCRCLTAPVD